MYNIKVIIFELRYPMFNSRAVKVGRRVAISAFTSVFLMCNANEMGIFYQFFNQSLYVLMWWGREKSFCLHFQEICIHFF